MTSPLWLIAERELRTYVATASFWAALAIGPLAALALAAFAGGHPPVAVTIQAAGEDLAKSARAAVEEAARLEGRSLDVGQSGSRLRIRPLGRNTLEISFTPDFPLSRAGRMLVERTLERDAARRLADSAPVAVETGALAPRGPGTAGVARFASVCILWLTLTGSLGMLLQAVVRERANRALESLLAAARPWEIVAGKLAGVGAVSLLVLAVWLGSAAGLSVLLPSDSGASLILTRLAAPAALARAALIYLLAYAFYGSITIAVGALARDVAAAQNLSRPMFVVLLIAFFVTMSWTSGSGASWLAFVPAFTPFLLLVSDPGAYSPAIQAVLLAILLAGAMITASFAASCLSISRPRIGDVVAKIFARAPVRFKTHVPEN